MSEVIFLDSGPLGLVSNPNLSAGSMACSKWMESLLVAGHRIVIPEIADYEIRRELLRANKLQGISQLDQLIADTEYLPITTSAMRKAAEFWAHARQQGHPAAGDNTIDGDMILAAQFAVSGEPNAIIATTNPKHLAQLVHADMWQNISP